MLITRTSTLTGVTRSLEINVTQAQIDLWQAGALIQEAMPNLSLAEREYVMTGCTQEEWDETFGDENG